MRFFVKLFVVSLSLAASPACIFGQFGDDDPFGAAPAPVQRAPQNVANRNVQVPDAAKGLPVEPSEIISAAAKAAILEKAEQAFFESANLSPLELFESVVVLKNIPKLEAVFERFLYKLSETKLTPKQQFEIVEKFGTRLLSETLSAPKAAIYPKIQESLFSGAKQHVQSRPPLERLLQKDEPKTPLAILEAVDVLSRAGRIEVAKSYLKNFQLEQLTEEEASEIVEKLESRLLFALALKGELAPDAEKIVNTIYEKAKVFWVSPERIQQAIDSLGSENVDAESKAVTTLWQGTETSIIMLIERMSQTQNFKQLRSIQDVLVTMRAASKDALLATLQSRNPDAVLRSAETLSRFIPSQEMIALLPAALRDDLDDATRKAIAEIVQKRFGQSPSREEAGDLLFNRALEFYKKDRFPKSYPMDGGVPFWVLDSQTDKLEIKRLLPKMAHIFMLEQAAADAFAVSPMSKDAKQMYFVTLFIRHNAENKDSLELLDKASSLSDAELEMIVSKTYNYANTFQLDSVNNAAVVALELLANRNPAAETLCYPVSGSQTRAFRPIVEALKSKDPRVRFAALNLIMQIAPKRAFPGSSLVSDSLVYFMQSKGEKRAVVASLAQSESMRILGALSEFGFTGETALTRKEAILAAARTPDVELIIVDSRLLGAFPDVFAQELRNDVRTAKIPVAIVTTNDALLKNAAIDDNADFKSVVLPYPLNDAAVNWDIKTTLSKIDSVHIVAEKRLEHARKAADWLLEIVKRQSDGKEKIYHIENLEQIAIELLYSPVHTRKGIELSTLLKSNVAQYALAEMATQSIYPMEIRELAASGFSQSVDKHGVLIRGGQIVRLYDRYNLSETESKESQAVLGSLLDSIENRR